MATLICNGTGNLTGAATFAGAETGALALNLVRNTTASLATAASVTSATFTVTNAVVIDAVLLWVQTSGTVGTGTFKVDLQKGGVSQAAVTVNKSDLPDSTNAIPVPVLFKLTSTATGDGGANWTIVLTTTSGTGSATITYNINAAGATNLTRALRTTTAATAAAADNLFIIGELTGAGTHTARTVTMDSTATTAYGNGSVNSTTVYGGAIHISSYGTLSYGTTASTNYVLRVNGDVVVYQFGTLNIGASGSEIPRTSTAVLELQQASASGDFGLRVLDNAVWNAAGLSRTSGKDIVQCKLTADASASGGSPSTSSVSVDTDTGWLSGDIIAVASTTRTASQCEYGTLNANAGASSAVFVNMTAASNGEAIPPTSNRGLLNAHSGTAPTQAEIGLLTRNVKIRSTSTSLMAYVYGTALASVTVSWCQFYYLGANAATKFGVTFDGGTTASAKSFTFNSVHDVANGSTIAVFMTAASTTSQNCTVSNNVIWNANSGIVLNNSLTLHDFTLDSNLIMSTGGVGFGLSDVGGTITNNTVAGASGFGFNLLAGASALGTFSGNTVHSSSNIGFNIQANYAGNMSSCKVWRTTSWGIQTSNWAPDTKFVDLINFGNQSGGINSGSEVTISGTSAICGDTTFSSPIGVQIPGGLDRINLSGVDFSSSGIATIGAANSTCDINIASSQTDVSGVANNCKFGTNTFNTNTKNNWSRAAYVSFEKYGQTAGDHRTEMTYGQLKTDTSIFNTASPSMRMTPNNASLKLQSAPNGAGMLVAMASGGTVSISVYIRKSIVGDGAAYTGNQPRLIQRANAALGQNSDVVLATYSAGTGAWNQLSATSSTAGDDGAWEFIVDCDGTAGWINVDDWAAV